MLGLIVGIFLCAVRTVGAWTLSERRYKGADGHRGKFFLVLFIVLFIVLSGPWTTCPPDPAHVETLERRGVWGLAGGCLPRGRCVVNQRSGREYDKEYESTSESN